VATKHGTPALPNPAERGSAKRVEIKLNTIYTTTTQPSLERFPTPYDNFSRNKLPEIRMQLAGLGVPDAFLVAAEDVYSAIYLTSAVLTAGRPGSEVWLDPVRDEPSGELPKIVWVFVNLELQGSPRYWDLARVELDGNQIFVTYHGAINLLGGTYATSFPHAYWIPLPQLREGEYTIKLREEANIDETIIRRVFVRVPKHS
jgi:hypothetical protein